MRKQSWGAIAPPKANEIDSKRLRQLRQLCHPDRHDNSPLSLEVFKWLNDEVSKELDKNKSTG